MSARARIGLLCSVLAASCGGDGGSGSGSSSGGGGSASSDGAWFREVAQERGIDFEHIAYRERRFWIPEITSGGVALFDFDGDGALDLYCVQSGAVQPMGQGPERNRLYKGDGAGGFVDVTEGSGVDDPGYGHGVATGDYDGDGDLDLFVANVGANKLFRNDGGGAFTDVTDRAGVAGDAWSAGAVFADYDLDGDYDLFVVNNLNWAPTIERECRSSRGELDYCAPLNYKSPSADTLYRNEGDGTFTDVSEEVGLLGFTGPGWGVAAADFNGDGYPDFYVTNDGYPNAMWYSDGKGKFTEQAGLAGCAVNANGRAEAGMGIQVFDVKNDGGWDLFMTHVRDESNTFYAGNGAAFSDRTSITGLGHSSMRYTGFGMGFHDFDLDGLLDLFIANGGVTLFRPLMRENYPYAEPNQLYRGLGDGKFEELPGPTEEPLVHVSRATAFGDVDNDGDIDIVYVDNQEPLKFLENVAPRRGGWVGFHLLDPRGSDAMCAVAEVRLEGDCVAPTQRKWMQTSYSFCAANDPRLHFGTGDATAVSTLTVTWPDGNTSTHGPFELGAYHVVRQAAD